MANPLHDYTLKIEYHRKGVDKQIRILENTNQGQGRRERLNDFRSYHCSEISLSNQALKDSSILLWWFGHGYLHSHAFFFEKISATNTSKYLWQTTLFSNMRALSCLNELKET